MATPGLQKFLFSVVLAASLLATPASAAPGDGHWKTCPPGQVKDESDEHRCCPLHFLEDEEGVKVCATPTDTSVAVALTLIFSFTFLISLQCFMNHHDRQMRKYAYTGISSTISIFSAVLFFQSFSGMVKDVALDFIQDAFDNHQIPLNAGLIVGALQTLLWYIIAQIALAHASGALKKDDWHESQLRLASKNESHQQEMLNIEINSVCYGLLLAHVTGFASIELWTHVQALERVKSSGWLLLLILPASVLVQLILEWLMLTCRKCYKHFKHFKHGWFVARWDEKCRSAEDDIMALTLSVVIVNTLRYGINLLFGHDCLPNSEQNEEGHECSFRRTPLMGLLLFGLGILFSFLLFFTKLFFVRIGALQFKEEKKMDGLLSDLIVGDLKIDEDESDEDIVRVAKARTEDVILLTLGMCYAWCIFHGTQQLVVALEPFEFFIRKENATILAVCLAFYCTYMAFLIIRILVCVQELPDEWTPPDVDESIVTVIRGVSIYVGFAWERTFDIAIENLAGETKSFPMPHIPVWLRKLIPSLADFAIAGCCITVIFLAWKWYILPFVMKRVWRYGYIYSKHDLRDAFHKLAFHDQQFHSFLQGNIEQVMNELHPSKRKSAEHSRSLWDDHAMYEAIPVENLAEALDFKATPTLECKHRANSVKIIEPSYSSSTSPSASPRASNRASPHAMPISQERLNQMNQEELRIRVQYLESKLAEEQETNRQLMERQLADGRTAFPDVKSDLQSDVLKDTRVQQLLRDVHHFVISYNSASPQQSSLTSAESLQDVGGLTQTQQIESEYSANWHQLPAHSSSTRQLLQERQAVAKSSTAVKTLEAMAATPQISSGSAGCYTRPFGSTTPCFPGMKEEGAAPERMEPVKTLAQKFDFMALSRPSESRPAFLAKPRDVTKPSFAFERKAQVDLNKTWKPSGSVHSHNVDTLQRTSAEVDSPDSSEMAQDLRRAFQVGETSPKKIHEKLRELMARLENVTLE